MAKKKASSKAGLFVPAGIFVGLGVGLAIDQVPAGLFVGMGLGFLAMALTKNC